MFDTSPFQPLTRDAAEQPRESFADPAFGTVTWQTLFTGDRTATEALTCGLAHLEPGTCLALHRHAQPEIYFGVSGHARVMIAGAWHDIRPGVAVFIPGGAVHGIFAGEEAASFFYAFATDSFAEVVYEFLPAALPDQPESIVIPDAHMELLDEAGLPGAEGRALH